MRILLITSLALSLSAQEPITLQAPIQRVRLHPNEAWITRSGKVQLPGAGTHRILIKDLPPGLRVEDLQASARGPAGLRLGDLSVKSEVRTVKETPEWKKLRAEQLVMAKKRDALEAQGEAMKQEMEFLKNLQSNHDKEISLRMTYATPEAGAIVNLSKGVHERIAELIRMDRERTRALDELAQEENLLNAELDKCAGQMRSPSQVSIELTSLHPGPTEVDLSYRTQHAHWRPMYEARLSEDRKNLSLALFAVVTQYTGEAWNHVRLEINSSRLSSNIQAPSFSMGRALSFISTSTLLKTSAPVRGSGGNQIMYRIDGINVKDDAGGGSLYMPLSDSIEDVYAPPPPFPMTEAIAATSSLLENAQGLASTFLIDGYRDVQSTNEPHRFKVLARDMHPQMGIFTAPRLDPTAFLMARFSAPTGLPLFPGSPVVRFAGNQRLGEAPMTIPLAGQSFSLTFGPYTTVRTSFRKVDMKQETVGSFTKEHQWTLKERVDLDNDGNENLMMEVQDRILTASTDQIKITPLPGFTEGSSEEMPGVRTWKFNLAPKSHKTLELPVSIRAPKEGLVTGLEGMTLGQP